MIEEVMTQVFDDADQAHKDHLLTDSYAEHVALGDFYEAAREQVDVLIEAMIALDMPAPEAGPNSLARLEESYAALMQRRDDFCQGVATLENHYDELCAVYLRAIYKLKRLVKA